MEKDVLLFALVIVTLASAQNECSNTVYKELGKLAKRSPTYFQDAVPLCDRYLLKSWYFTFYNEMPTTAPGLGYCGTTYPYWLDDTLPNTQGSSKAVKVCEVGFMSECSRSHFIQVTNCGSFFVYELTPLDICSSAYCFKPNKACVADVPSNIFVAYHGVTWTTSNHTANTNHDPDVNLVCQFDRLPDQSLFYDVTWYVDDIEVLTNQTVSSDSSDLALLTGSQILAKGKKANSMIHCIVGAKIRATDIPCKTNASSLFFAGIKVLNTILKIPRGGHKDVELQFTIPFVSAHLIIGTGKGIEMQSSLLISLGVHNESGNCNDPNRKNCDIKVSAFKKQEANKYATDEWKTVHSFTFYNKDDGDFTPIDKHITLRLETGGTTGTGSKLFENLILPDIQVYIEDTNSAWKGAYCESHTDPHMKTFDQK